MENPEKLYDVLDYYVSQYETSRELLWLNKIGIADRSPKDAELLSELTNLLQKCEIDMTIFFREFCHITCPDINELSYAFYNFENAPVKEWDSWLEIWWERVNGSPDRKIMLVNNPKYVLRNWMAQLAIDAAEDNDYLICNQLHQLLKDPYAEQKEFETDYYQKMPEWAKNRVGCSMLSCSS